MRAWFAVSLKCTVAGAQPIMYSPMLYTCHYQKYTRLAPFRVPTTFIIRTQTHLSRGYMRRMHLYLNQSYLRYFSAIVFIRILIEII